MTKLHIPQMALFHHPQIVIFASYILTELNKHFAIIISDKCLEPTLLTKPQFGGVLLVA